jgi:membrane protease subunit HflK
MQRGSWTQGPIDIGGSTVQLRLPQVPKVPPGAGRLLLAGLALLVLFVTGYYQVEPDEVGVVQRFGAYVRTAEPGPHLKIPFAESVTKVPVQRQLKMEFGFRTTNAAQRSEFAETPETRGEAVMLTGDLNVAVVEWIVQFRIKDARAFLFHVRDVPETFRYMSEAAMRQVVGDHSVDEVLTIGREAIALLAKEELQRLCNLYEIGIEVQQLVLQDVNPPDPVNDAWADYNKAVPRARGEAEQAIRAAEGYAVERVNNAQGDARRFEAFHEEYRKAPAVTRKRIYLETMGTLIPKAGRKLVLDENARGILPLLQLEGARAEVKQ